MFQSERIIKMLFLNIIFSLYASESSQEYGLKKSLESLVHDNLDLGRLNYTTLSDKGFEVRLLLTQTDRESNQRDDDAFRELFDTIMQKTHHKVEMISKINKSSIDDGPFFGKEYMLIMLSEKDVAELLA